MDNSPISQIDSHMARIANQITRLSLLIGNLPAALLWDDEFLGRL